MYRKQKDPCFISTQRILMDLPLTLPEIPKNGAGVFASASSIVVGGGFTILSAVARQGIKSYCVSPLGTGPNAKQIRDACQVENIGFLIEEVVGDNGMNLNLRDTKGNYTYIINSGVESEPQLPDLNGLNISLGDYVFISGIDLSVENSASVLLQWCENIKDKATIVFSPGPFYDKISADVIDRILKIADIFTVNKRELAGIFMRDFMDLVPVDSLNVENICLKHYDENMYEFFVNKFCDCDDYDDYMWQILSSKLKKDSLVVVRNGSHDCLVKNKISDDEVIVVPCFKKEYVDMVGVADAHTGVFVAGLMIGHSVFDSVRRANYAASICASKFGYADCPTAMELDFALKDSCY